MKPFLNAAVACILAFLMVSPAFAGDDPEAIIETIYAQYGEGGVAFDVPSKYFTSGLLDLWTSVDAVTDGGVEKALGFEVFTEAGDDDVIVGVQTSFINGKYVVVSFMAMVEDAKAIVGHKKYFMYSFVETPDGWKIDDIDWGRAKPTLREMLLAQQPKAAP